MSQLLDSATSPLTRALARFRVPLGFALAVVVLWLARPTTATLLAGGTIAAAGELLRIWAAGHLEKSREVTCSGPYRWLRHPLYVGSAVMGAGLAVAAGSVPVAAIVAAYLVTTIGSAISTEEAFLRTRFGSEWRAYRAGRTADRRRFSVERALRNREYRAVAGMLLALLILAVKALYP